MRFQYNVAPEEGALVLTLGDNSSILLRDTLTPEQARGLAGALVKVADGLEPRKKRGRRKQ